MSYEAELLTKGETELFKTALDRTILAGFYSGGAHGHPGNTPGLTVEQALSRLPHKASAVKLYWRNQQKRWLCEVFWLVNDDYEVSVVGEGVTIQDAALHAVALHDAHPEACTPG